MAAKKITLVDENQGTENAGKVLIIGDDGKLAPQVFKITNSSANVATIDFSYDSTTGTLTITTTER